ncbi:MAG: hypothetical protein WC248_05855 [Candidatus Methanomethylophilaceae archaeon]|jgi:predicted transcriptional regulator
MNEIERKIYQYNVEVITKFKDRTDMTESQERFYQRSVEYVKRIDEKKNIIEPSIWRPMISDGERTRMQEHNARYERNNK